MKQYLYTALPTVPSYDNYDSNDHNLESPDENSLPRDAFSLRRRIWCIKFGLLLP